VNKLFKPRDRSRSSLVAFHRSNVDELSVLAALPSLGVRVVRLVLRFRGAHSAQRIENPCFGKEKGLPE
jgi:hypothetical protein